MKKLLMFLGITITAFSMTRALASTPSGGAVPAWLTYQANGWVYVYFPNSIRSGTIPTCAVNIGGTYYRLVIDTNTAGGKSQLAGLIAAHFAGESVGPWGTGNCNVDGVTESLSYFQ